MAQVTLLEEFPTDQARPPPPLRTITLEPRISKEGRSILIPRRSHRRLRRERDSPKVLQVPLGTRGRAPSGPQGRHEALLQVGSPRPSPLPRPSVPSEVPRPR